MEYLKNGFHLEKNIFSKKEILVIRKEIYSIFKNFCPKKLNEDEIIKYVYKNDLNAFLGCANLCQNLISMHKLSVSPKLEKSVLNLGLKKLSVNTRPLISFSSKETAKNDNYWKVPQHQDWPSTQGSLNGVTCWLPLTYMQSNMGFLEVCPMSHMLGFLEHTDNKGVPVLHSNMKFKFKKIKMQIGDVLFFSNFLIHKSGENKSKKIRLSAHFRFDDYTEKTFIQRKFPKTRIDKRIDNILYPNFPDEKTIYATFSNDNI
jgi:hypothetical protein